MKNCIYCNREINNIGSLKAHEYRCKSNPSRDTSKKKYGIRKPLSPEAKLQKIEKFRKSFKISYDLGQHKKIEDTSNFKGVAHTPELEKLRRSRLSIALKSYGGYRQGGGRGKHGYYKEIWCDSSWELAYVIYNLENNILFKRNHERFPYFWNECSHNYLPDFILDDKTYVEIKGYFSEQFKSKLSQFPKDKLLIVIDKVGIKKYIDYVTYKYGKDYIRLYDNFNKENKNDLVKELKFKEKDNKNKIKLEQTLLKEKKSLIKKETIKLLINTILESDINFKEYGWVSKVSLILKISPQKVNKWMIRNMNDFYKNECFIRQK